MPLARMTLDELTDMLEALRALQYAGKTVLEVGLTPTFHAVPGNKIAVSIDYRMPDIRYDFKLPDGAGPAEAAPVEGPGDDVPPEAAPDATPGASTDAAAAPGDGGPDAPVAAIRAEAEPEPLPEAEPEPLAQAAEPAMPLPVNGRLTLAGGTIGVTLDQAAEIFRLANLGWTTPEIQMETGLQASLIKTVFDDLTGLDRDTRKRRFTVAEVDARLADMLAARAAA